jgi:heme-degrading monooxygenase HmoA
MVTEIALLSIADGRGGEFEQIMRSRGRAVLEAAAGAHSVEIGRCVEEPMTYVLIVEWDSVDAHQRAAKDPVFLEFRELQRSLHSEAPSVRHFAPID